MEEKNELKKTISENLKIYNQIAELNSIKRLIKDNVKKNEDGKIEISMFFADDLLKLIKYIDIEFYNELQQG